MEVSRPAFAPGLIVAAGHVSYNALDCLKIMIVFFQLTFLSSVGCC